MESKIPIFWEKGNSDKVNPKFNPYFLLFFFQGSKEGGREVGEAAMVVPVRGKFRLVEDRLGELGENLSSKGEWWIGRVGFSKIQQCFTWKMMEPLPPSGKIVGKSIGLQI